MRTSPYWYRFHRLEHARSRVELESVRKILLYPPYLMLTRSTADHESSFEGDISTSNWLASEEVWIKTSRPIWWSIELKGFPKL